jgi:epoxyqueuosine reductase QueG
MESVGNSRRLEEFVGERLRRIGHDGVVGVAELKKVYGELMPVQKRRLVDLCGKGFRGLLKCGSVICVGIAYPERAIDCIDVRLSGGSPDREAWNVYADEYRRINGYLNAIACEISCQFGGVAVPATVENVVVRSVEDYYGLAVSHRVVAENAGLGWRGKNELVVNERFGCALRFASVITGAPLVRSGRVEGSCGDCEACLEVCTFLRNKDRLENYRESCRRYIVRLGLRSAVCGKCVRACYRQGKFAGRFKLS